MKNKERERESTQVWVKRAKPKGCKAISLQRALIATMTHTKIEVACIFYKAINTLYLEVICVLYKATDTLC
jgi:hypothetical protein